MRVRHSTPLQERLQERLRAHKRPARRESPYVLADRRKRKAMRDIRNKENARDMRLSEMGKRSFGGW